MLFFSINSHKFSFLSLSDQKKIMHLNNVDNNTLTEIIYRTDQNNSDILSPMNSCIFKYVSRILLILNITTIENSICKIFVDTLFRLSLSENI